MELLADRDLEEARKLLDPVLERMMEAVHSYEGTVNQAMGDGIMELFGAPLSALQMTEASIAEMAMEIDASALLVYRSAWAKDCYQERVTREAAMAKLYATEAAQKVIDRAVQLFGGMGVVSGMPVEKLYREVRALRIYEGTTEINKLVIAQQTMQAFNRNRETAASGGD